MASTMTVRVILLAALVVSSVETWTTGASANGPKAPENFTTLCAPCHGPAGKGDAPAAAFLNPKPRNFTNGEYMNARTDAQLFNEIKNGGPSEGLSELMISFGNQLTDTEIKEIIVYIRSLAMPKYQPKK